MWPSLSVAYIESVMSPALYASYLQWLTDNPGKVGRLQDIINRTTAEFRSAMLANGSPVPLSPATSIPASCVRHAQNMILFELRREIGLTITESENATALRADVFIRGIWSGLIPINRDTTQLSPSYVPLASPIEDP